MEFLQQLVNGIALGGVYSLIAIGWTTVFGIVGMINWTHGEIFMIGAFTGYFLVGTLHLSLPLALIFSMLASGLTAALVDRLAYRPLRARQAPNLALFITALGASTFLRNLGTLLWQPHSRAYASTVPLRVVTLFSVNGRRLTVNNLQLVILLAATVIMIALQLFISRTRLGKAMLAASQDFEMVGLMGVEPENLVVTTFFLSGLLGGAAGVLVGALYAIDPMMGVIAGSKGWAAAVLGGVGSITGAMFAGVALGVAENLTVGYISTGYRDAIGFVIMMLTLLLRPTGLFGAKSEEKV